MPFDALAVFAASETVTASHNDAWVDFKTTPGTPRGGMAASFEVTSDLTTGVGTYHFEIHESSDQSEVQIIFQSPEIALAVAPANITRLPVHAPFILTQRYARSAIVVTSTSGSQSITYDCRRHQE